MESASLEAFVERAAEKIVGYRKRKFETIMTTVLKEARASLVRKYLLMPSHLVLPDLEFNIHNFLDYCLEMASQHQASNNSLLCVFFSSVSYHHATEKEGQICNCR